MWRILEGKEYNFGGKVFFLQAFCLVIINIAAHLIIYLFTQYLLKPKYGKQGIRCEDSMIMEYSH